jgi:hypothetical protein
MLTAIGSLAVQSRVQCAYTLSSNLEFLEREAHTIVAVTSDTVQENFQNAWGKRLQALKNIPPVLRIIWDSSPAVVSAE